MDKLTVEQRRKNMQAIKCKGSQIELLLTKELWSRGLRYRKNVKNIIGKKIAVFCDSEFWHGYDWENKQKEIKSNREFWIPKIEKNILRDEEVTQILKSEGWTVIRFWGHEIKKNVKYCADVVEKAVEDKQNVL